MLDAKTVVYMGFRPPHRYLYLGKTLNFSERLRKHTLAFLRPGYSARTQAYMSFLTMISEGSASRALADMLFFPLALCSDESSALALEHHFISTAPPSLKDPYVFFPF